MNYVRTLLKAIACAVAAALPALALAVTSPVTLDFGAQSMGTSRTLRINIVAEDGLTAGSTLPMSVATSNPQVHVSAASCAGTAAAPCTVDVTFSPLASLGTLNDKLAVQGNVTFSVAGSTETYVLPVKGTAERSLVEHFYREILGRASDAGGKAFWEGEAQRVASGGGDLNEVWFAMSKTFTASAEGKAKAATDYSGDAAYVDWLYRIYFRREADDAGLAFWTQQLTRGASREDLQVAFMLSTEFRLASTSLFGDTTVRPEVSVVHDFFRGLLGRAPDSLGFNFWTATLRTAQCNGAAAVRSAVDSISSDFLRGAEYQARGRNTSQRVTDLFDAFLRRGPEPEGAAYWQSVMATDPETVRRAFLASPEFSARVDAIVAAGCLP